MRILGIVVMQAKVARLNGRRIDEQCVGTRLNESIESSSVASMVIPLQRIVGHCSANRTQRVQAARLGPRLRVGGAGRFVAIARGGLPYSQ